MTMTMKDAIMVTIKKNEMEEKVGTFQHQETKIKKKEHLTNNHKGLVAL